MIGAVDWHLLLLFTCLFGITEAFSRTGLAQDGLVWLEKLGLYPERISLMAPVTLAASNTIGNVPFVVLFTDSCLTSTAAHSSALRCSQPLRATFCSPALCATLSWRSARPAGAKLGFMDFARSGIPITLLSMAATIGWLLFTKLVIL